MGQWVAREWFDCKRRSVRSRTCTGRRILSRRRWDTAVRVNDGIGARTSETSTTHVRSLMCFVGMCDSTHFLTVAIASCAVRWVGCRGEMAVGCR